MGTEFQVNTYENNWQRASHVTALKNGGFVVTYESYLNDYDDGVAATTVLAQFYDADGKRVGGEKLIRGVDQAYAGAPHATQLANGNVVFTWAETRDDDIFTTGANIFARVFDTRGNGVSGVVKVDTVKSAEAVAPQVVALGDGGFTVTFGTEGESSRFDQVYHRSYSANGTPRGADANMNTVSYEFDESVTKTASLLNGNSVAIWNSEAAIKDGTDDGQNQLRATLFDSHGKVVRADFGLTEHFGGAGGAYSDDENYGYAVAARADGGFAVANLDYTPSTRDGGTMGVYFTAYDAKGRADGKAVTVFDKAVVPGDLAMARLSSGHYVVTWDQQSLNDSRDGDDAYAIVLASDGTPVTRAFEIGSDRFDYDDQTDTSVAALAGGGFAVTYTSDSVDSDNDGVAARLFGRGTSASDTLTVDASGMLYGLGGNDRLTGNGQVNRLFGDDGNDTLSAGPGNDQLTGGAGVDRLYGGAGSDTFIFRALTDSRSAVSAQDTIYDFARGDRFSLSSLDADTTRAGNQAFAFIGTAKFSGDAGELRYEKKVSDTYVTADVNGDKKVDFGFHLDDAVSLAKTDFLL